MRELERRVAAAEEGEEKKKNLKRAGRPDCAVFDREWAWPTQNGRGFKKFAPALLILTSPLITKI